MGRVAATGALMFLVLPVSPAWAHAAYKDSGPADKSSVSSPPSEVWAEFTEPPSQSSRLEIFDPCGEQVDLGSSNVTAYRITTGMSADKTGTYTVRFYVTSDLDSHPTTGSFSFTSTGGAPCPGSEGDAQADERPADDGGGAGDGSDAGDPAPSGSDPSSEGGEGGLGGSGQDASDAPGGRDLEAEKKRHGGKHGAGKHDRGQRHDGKKGKDGAASVAAETPAEEPSGAPSEGEIPMDWLMISFGIAGAVGAAGGKVYAGLMGPR